MYLGKECTLTQQPRFIWSPHSPHFEAAGIDSEGNKIIVYWAIKEQWLKDNGMPIRELKEDTSEMCDWENPVGVEKYNWR